MTLRPLARIGMCMALCLSTAVPALPVLAQAPGQPPPARNETSKESMTFTVGDILEMLPVHDFPSATYAWVLTEGETFVQAGRAPFFRFRFIRPGAYILHGEVTGTGNERIRREFNLNVGPRNHAQSSAAAEQQPGTLVTSTPPADAQGRMALRPGSQVVTLAPVSIDRRPLFLDLDTNVDSDGNGDPSDDRDAAESFFETSALPLQLWLTSLSKPRTIGIRFIDGPNAGSQRMTILTGASAVEQGVIKPMLRIASRSIGPGTLQFSLVFEAGIPNVPLLARWNFGDGSESLLTEPTHTYEGSGEQTVTVVVRNLLTGQEIATASSTVSPEGGSPSSAAGPAAQSSSSVAATGVGSSFGKCIWRILTMLFIFLVAAGVGALIVYLLKKLRGGRSLQEGLATLEKTLVKDNAKQENAPAKPGAPTLTFAVAPAPAAQAKPAQAAPSSAAATSAPKPQPQPAPPAATPSWLQKGLDAAPAVKTESPAPATAPAPKPSPIPAPAPAQPESPPPPKPQIQPAALAPKPAAAPAALGSSGVPPWLAGNAPQKTAPAAPAAPAPKPAAIQPKAVQETPPWLAGTAKPQTPAPATLPVKPEAPAPISPPSAEKTAPKPQPSAPAKPAPAAPAQASRPQPPPPTPTKTEPKPQPPLSGTGKASEATHVPTPQESAPQAEDKPVAFIQVDSLDKQQTTEAPEARPGDRDTAA